MDPKLLSITHRVLQAASRERPADAVLRQELRKQSGLARTASRQISRAVFAYYRWFGWLDQRAPLDVQIPHALELADTYARKPETFSDDDLVERAVPSWTSSEVNVSPAWLRQLQSEPVLWLRARRGQGRELARRLNDCRILGQGELADTIEYLGRTDLFRTKEFHDGLFELQDISSQAVGLICNPAAGETWWDACAGEGGKLLHLSQLMNNRGLIWATDPSQSRLKVLQRRAARSDVFNYRIAAWHPSSRLPIKTKFHGILVDAPCSGIGTWQRNPQARWTTTPDDVKRLATLQSDLLRKVSNSLRPGGKLVYAVCTLGHSETVDVATSFETSVAGLERASIRSPLETSGELVPGVHKSPVASTYPEVWLWPQAVRGNGMFVAAWNRLKP
jgi:16S rRNA (cytosine967-C5)-methyltransferase